MARRLRLLYHRQIVSNSAGFSLTEMAVVLGLVAIIGLGNVFFVNDFLGRMKTIEKESGEEADAAIISATAVNILKKSNLSFNRLKLMDDSNQNFFDFYPDVPAASLGANAKRSFKITATQLDRHLYLFSSNEVDAESIVVDPVHLYTVSAQPTDLRQDGTVNYQALNSIPNIKDSNGQNTTSRLMTKVFNKRWSNGNLFAVTCPTYLRPVSASGSVDILSVPRMPSFVGKVNVNDLVAINKSESVVEILNTNPITGAAYPNLDNYFRNLPTVGGAAPFVKVEALDLVRFRFKANSAYPAGYADLVLDKLQNGLYKEHTVVANRIKSIHFMRESVAIPIINMEIER